MTVHSNMTDQELDRQIAENIMGYTLANSIYYTQISKFPAYCMAEDGVDIIYKKGDRFRQYNFRPSTDMNNTYEVLEKMNNGYFFKLTKAPSKNGDSNGWWAEFSIGSESSLANDKDMSRAICLAALKACGVEIN